MKKLLFALLMAGCGGGGSGGAPEDGLAEPVAETGFTFSPIALGDLQRIIALGNLNPPGHTIPTDHMYFYGWYHDFGPPPDPNRRYTIHAPAGGVVTSLFQPENDYKIVVRVNDALSYYLDHILPAQHVQVGVKLEAGEIIGTSSNVHAIDMGATRADRTLSGFVKPQRYHEQTLHAVSPLEYFVEPLRSQLLAKVWRVGDDKHGKIDLDQPGRLVGNWFLQGVPLDKGDWPENWDKQLAFVSDVYDPAILRVSIGGQLAMTGAYATNGPDFATITPQSGKVAYRLYNRGGLGEIPDWANPLGLLIVRMLDDETIRVEAFAGALVDADFTPGARIYTR